MDDDFIDDGDLYERSNNFDNEMGICEPYYGCDSEYSEVHNS